jgi:hypothetical protein
MPMSLALSPWKVAAVLGILLAVLVGMDYVLQQRAYEATGSLSYAVHEGLAEPEAGVDYPGWFMEEMRLRFDLDRENNVPTWYSSALLLVAAIVLAVVGIAVKRRGSWLWPHWFVLSAVFVVLSVDETVRLHELMGGREGTPGTALLKEFGLVGNVHFYFDWILAGAAFVVILAVLCVPLLVRLPWHILAMLTVAVGVYLAGVIGLEAVSAAEVFEKGETWRYHEIIVVEEALEGAGMILGLFGLLTYVRWLERAPAALTAAVEEAGSASGPGISETDGPYGVIPPRGAPPIEAS